MLAPGQVALGVGRSVARSPLFRSFVARAQNYRAARQRLDGGWAWTSGHGVLTASEPRRTRTDSDGAKLTAGAVWVVGTNGACGGTNVRLTAVSHHSPRRSGAGPP